MADYTTILVNSNTNTDASPTWSTGLALSGSAGANELRFVNSGLGATGATASASWPNMSKPAPTGSSVVNQCWTFTADTTGSQVATYDGTNGKANVFRWNFDNLGSPVTAMQMTCFTNSTHTAPSPGTQPPGANNDAFTNGTAESSNASLIKFNVYGSGFPAAGAQETPAAGTVGNAPTVLSGTAGSVTSSAGAWITNWQSAQGWIQFVTAASVAKVTTAFFWYWTMVIYLAATMSGASYTPIATLLYSYS